ncbi:hypothetical protein AVEN_157215-1, partial [Araneus ventricosus]
TEFCAGIGGRSERVVGHGRRPPGSKPDSTKDPPCMWACFRLNHMYSCKHSADGGSLERGHSSSSSSDCCSKLGGPSQNSPLVASEREVNMTKLN